MRLCIKTAPHVVEPKYPGLCETILNLGDCWNKEQFAGKEKEILELYVENSRVQDRSGRYITAAASLMADSYRIALDCTDTAKAARFGAGLAKRLIGTGEKKQGREWIRFLSGITPKGLVFYRSTLEKMCDNIVEISDDYGAASRVILSVFRAYALELGHTIITCPCPFTPGEKIEHIIVPDLHLAVCTTNRYLQVGQGERRIHARRFTDIGGLRQKKQRLAFNRRAVKELLEGACDLAGECKFIHDQIEQYYIPAMNFGKVTSIGNQVISELETRMLQF